MSTVELSCDDFVEAVCNMLDPIVMKGALPREDCNRWGVDVLYSKSDKKRIMFHFVTKDLLEINLEYDLGELQARGKEYLDHQYGLLLDQLEQARKVRQEESKITILNTGSHVAKQEKEKQPPKMKPAAAAHNEVLH